MIQRLALPLRMDDTQTPKAFHFFFLKMDKGATSQEMWAVSKSQKKQRNGFSPRASRKEHTDILILAQWAMYLTSDLLDCSKPFNLVACD